MLKNKIFLLSALVLVVLILGFYFFYTQPIESNVGPVEKEFIKKPIHITLDVHSHSDDLVEAAGGSPKFQERRKVFQSQLDDVEWLLETTEKHNAKISFLSVGPWAELCINDQNFGGRCFKIVKKLYESGGMIGTHSHNLKYNGQFNSWTKDNTPGALYDYMHIDFVNQLIEGALDVHDPEEIKDINLAYGSNHPSGTIAKHKRLAENNFKMKEGGEDQEFILYFNHIPYNPFKVGNGKLIEDLNSQILNPPQYPIYTTETHGHIPVDTTFEHQKAMFLQLYLNWRVSEEDKIWTFGFGSHVHNFGTEEQEDLESRERLEKILEWLDNNFISQTYYDGEIAKPSNYRMVLDDYEEWETQNPGVSSFNYELDYTDYDYYPYLPWVNKYLRNTIVKEDIEIGNGVGIFLMQSGTNELILGYSDVGESTQDLSEYFQTSNVKRVFLETGDSDEIDPSSFILDERSIVLCIPETCDAILNDPTGTTPKP